MSRPFLFGGSTGGQSQNKYLVEFRAGKMSMKGKMVHPDKRKGTVYVHQTDDSLMHFCWKDRTSGEVEDDLIIFPDDTEFKRVAECTTGRVYVLKFKSSTRRCFYWVQEPKTDKDEDYCSKVNEYLNNPPVPGSGHGSGLGSSGSSHGGLGSLQSDLSNLGDSDLQSLLNNMSQQQLVQLLGGVGGISGVANLTSLLSGSRSSSMQSPSATSTATSAAPTPPPRSAASETPSSDGGRPSSTPSSTATPTPTPQSVTPAAASTPSIPASSSAQQSAAQIQLSDLQNILSGLNVPAEQAAATGVAVDLSTAITAEALAPLLNNAALMERIHSLLPNPDSPGTPDETPVASSASASAGGGAEKVKTTVQSPQFQQALSAFSAALQSGQLGPLMLQFGLGQEVVNAANSGDMEAFVRALQSSQSGEAKDKKDPDEEMSLD